EAVLDGDRQLDEVERVQADRVLDAFRQRRLEGQVDGAARIELEPAHEDRLELVEHFLGFHNPPDLLKGRLVARRPSAPPTTLKGRLVARPLGSSYHLLP